MPGGRAEILCHVLNIHYGVTLPVSVPLYSLIKLTGRVLSENQDHLHVTSAAGPLRVWNHGRPAQR